MNFKNLVVKFINFYEFEKNGKSRIHSLICSQCFKISAVRTASSMIGSFHRNVVCLSVRLSVRFNAVHCGAQGRCRELKVVPSCSYQAKATFYLFLQTICCQPLNTVKRSDDNSKTNLKSFDFAVNNFF